MDSMIMSRRGTVWSRPSRRKISHFQNSQEKSSYFPYNAAISPDKREFLKLGKLRPSKLKTPPRGHAITHPYNFTPGNDGRGPI